MNNSTIVVTTRRALVLDIGRLPSHKGLVCKSKQGENRMASRQQPTTGVHGKFRVLRHYLMYTLVHPTLDNN